MVTRDTLVAYLDSFLKIDDIPDKSLNGLQVEGKDKIKTIGLAVDINEQTIRDSIRQKVDFLIVHHGLFWGTPLPVTGAHKTRVSLLLESGISLYASHLPLDRHGVVGNNRVLARQLKLQKLQRFGVYNGITLSYYGELRRKTALDQFAVQVRKTVAPDIFVVAGRDTVKRVGVVSGRGSSMFHECLGLNIDTFITGEQTHDLYAEAVDNRINLIFAGHYQTETVGVKALGVHLGKKFKGCMPVFIQCPTGL